MADYSNPEQPAEPLVDEDLQTLVRTQIDNAVSFINELAPERARLADYYEGLLPDLPAPEGRSQAVATVVRDTIVAMKPGLLRAFFGPERVVEFRPRKPEDVEQATQQTEYINYIVTEDNPGLMVFAAAMEDALVKDYGVLKWWWEESSETEGVTYEAISVEQLEGMMAEAMNTPGCEITIESVEPVIGDILKVAMTRTRTTGRARIAAVPPEEFIFPRSTRSLDSATFVGHRAMRTVSDLVGMGYDRAEVEACITASDELVDNEEATQRANWDGVDTGDMDDTPGGEAAKPIRRVKYVEAYLLHDTDGDGIAELRRICTIGDAYKIVHNAPAAERPFAVMMADPKPHTMQGRGIARRVDDLQAIESVITRGTLDSLALSICPRTEIVEGQVNLKDALNPELAALIRVKQPGMMREVKHSFVGPDTLPMLDYFESQRENRTGTSRAAAGLNPDALQSSTRAAVAATVTGSQQQQELVARFMAETGFKPVFKGLYQLVKRHQSEARMVKLFGSFVPVDPSSWDDADPDVSVNVALGMGMAEDKLASLGAIAMSQKEILATLGPINPIVTLKQYRDTLAKMAEVAGYKNSELFYQQVDPNWQPPPQEPPQPDPAAMQLAQIEMMKVQQDGQMQAARLQFDRERAEAELAFKQEQERMRDARERDQMLLDMEMERFKIESEQNVKLETAKLARAAVTPEPGV